MGFKVQLRFAFNKEKALEALAYIAQQKAGLTPLYVAKVMFFAEKWHINLYGRPIVADTYIAMPFGPVPSAIKNFIDQNWNWVERPGSIDDAITIDNSGRYARLMPGRRPPNLDLLSESDLECLQEAIRFCADKGLSELSDLTHLEKAWIEAAPNGAMNYVDFIDDSNPYRDQVLRVAEETAASGVL